VPLATRRRGSARKTVVTPGVLAAPARVDITLVRALAYLIHDGVGMRQADEA
jgi:hypothetical protein